MNGQSQTASDLNLWDSHFIGRDVDLEFCMQIELPHLSPISNGHRDSKMGRGLKGWGEVAKQED